ncbi:MAG: hypothetical protein NTZ33_00900 [Bacteroidetes bacterium]|nr:hypothetical protein [Bacteroidota bacterium]
MKIKVLFLIAFIFIAFTSCTKDTKMPNYVPNVPYVPPTDFGFAKDVYPLFASHSCPGCHGTSGGLTLSGTASVVRTNLITVGAVIPNNSSGSKLYSNFNGTSHKNISLTSTELKNIKYWIDSGAKDN